MGSVWPQKLKAFLNMYRNEKHNFLVSKKVLAVGRNSFKIWVYKGFKDLRDIIHF